MAFPKIKVCWNGSRVDADWRLGLFGVYTRGIAGGRLRGIVISGRGVFAWLTGLGVVAYFTGAVALWCWLDRRPHNRVTYVDLILPTRWSGIQKLRGQTMVAEGLDDLKAQRWGAALAKLRIGIARNPEEIEGRLALAEIFIAMKARKQAIEIYDGGLASRYPGRNYVETMLRSAMQSESYDWALRTCDRALALVAASPEYAQDRKWLIQNKLNVLISSDRAEEALVLAEKEGESGSPAINEYRVLALLKAGKVAAAVAFLDEWSRRQNERADSQVLRLQVRAYREAGNVEAMNQALEQLRAQSPTDPRVYVYGIVQQLMAGRRDEANLGLDRFLLRFGSTPEYLHMLAAPLAEIAERPLLENLIDYSRQQGFDLDPLRRFLVQSLIAKGDWRDAAKALEQIQQSGKKADAAAAWKALMHALVQAALDPSEGTQSNLVSLVRGRQFPLSIYKDLITGMRRAGRPATAREIITFAQGAYPQNHVIETWRKEVDGELAAAEAAKPVVVPSRASPTKEIAGVPLPARRELGEDEFLGLLDRLNKNGGHAEAVQAIREIRVSKPAWLTPAREVELSRNEVRFSGFAGDILTLRSSVRLFNNGDRLRVAQLVEIARELNTAGRKDEAIFLLKELLVKTPDYALAKRLLAEWSPKPAL